MMDMFVILIVVIASCIYTYIKTLKVVHYKYVQFAIYQLYLNKAILKSCPFQWQPPKILGSHESLWFLKYFHKKNEPI